ncbi:DUF3072 domain-containing protein [Shimia ponticola]|uniref:DUF3072 domain-containing protein n=1 Tax=Shimia ponticola TaxID=2582893 RepID=UPI00164B5823|nr:DUF3072 domain-containing protein [Shimia ponticola]
MTSNIRAAAAIDRIGMTTAGGSNASDTKPMTSLQADHLRALCKKADEPFLDGISEAEAEAKIQELERKTGTDVDGDGQAGKPLL